MAYYKGGIGNFAYKIESALGTSAGSWANIRPEEVPTFPTDGKKLIDNSAVGFRNPHTVEKQVHIDLSRESAINWSQRIRRATASGAGPSATAFFEAGGWAAQTTSGATECAADTTASLIKQDSNVTAIGQCILVERSEDVYVPALVADLSSDDATLAMALSAVPAENNAVEQMTTVTPTTATVYQVPTDKTLQFKTNSWAKDDDANGDFSYLFTGCGTASVGDIVFGLPGTFPILDFTLHAASIARTPDDIAADSFTDSAPFMVVNGDLEFAFAAASSSGAIANTTFSVESVTISPGLTTQRILGAGSGDGVNDVQGYMLMPTAPIITVTTQWQNTIGDTILDELEDDNSSKYIHIVQPSRSLAAPAFGAFMPNCHIQTDSVSVDHQGDMTRFTATFVGSTAGFDSETNITEYGASPIYLAFSGEASPA